MIRTGSNFVSALKELTNCAKHHVYLAVTSLWIHSFCNESLQWANTILAFFYRFFLQVLKDVTAVEFEVVLDILHLVGNLKSAEGRAGLFNIVADQIEIDQPFPVRTNFTGFEMSVNCTEI